MCKGCKFLEKCFRHSLTASSTNFFKSIMLVPGCKDQQLYSKFVHISWFNAKVKSTDVSEVRDV